MLKDTNINPHVAVKDLTKAREFYENVLGLNPAKEDDGGLYYQCGNGRLYVYESMFAGTNEATCASWDVKDIEKTVAELKAKGVTFEHYDDLGDRREGDIHYWGSSKAAWFKDPDGNIFVLAS